MIDRSYKDLLKMRRYPHTWCPGCGIGAVLKNVAMVLQELGWRPENTVAVSGIGCSGRMSGYMNLDAVHTPHGRALPAAEAIKKVREDLHVIVLSGDGDVAGIGGNHLLHTARRNPDITVICNDNEIYGLTGGQAGPTTPKGTRTLTSPGGERFPPLRLGRILTQQAPYFYARTTVYHRQHLQQCIREALLWKGFSFVDIISDCIELNGRRLGFRSAFQMLRWFDERFRIVEGPRQGLEEDELGIALAEEGPSARKIFEEEKEATRPTLDLESLRPISHEELERSDGREGNVLWVAYKGIVYDVSASPLFQGEKRMRCHLVGKDLTSEMENAPHGEERLFSFPVVGKLT